MSVKLQWPIGSVYHRTAACGAAPNVTHTALSCLYKLVTDAEDADLSEPSRYWQYCWLVDKTGTIPTTATVASGELSFPSIDLATPHSPMPD